MSPRVEYAPSRFSPARTRIQRLPSAPTIKRSTETSATHSRCLVTVSQGRPVSSEMQRTRLSCSTCRLCWRRNFADAASRPRLLSQSLGMGRARSRNIGKRRIQSVLMTAYETTTCSRTHVTPTQTVPALTTTTRYSATTSSSRYRSQFSKALTEE